MQFSFFYKIFISIKLLIIFYKIIIIIAKILYYIYNQYKISDCSYNIVLDNNNKKKTKNKVIIS